MEFEVPDIMPDTSAVAHFHSSDMFECTESTVLHIDPHTLPAMVPVGEHAMLCVHLKSNEHESDNKAAIRSMCPEGDMNRWYQYRSLSPRSVSGFLHGCLK